MVAKKSRREEVETPDGPLEIHVTSVDPVPQTIEPLGEDEVRRLAAAAARAPDFARAYLSGSESVLDLKEYDQAFRAWQRSSTPAHDAAEVVEILGAYLGQKCVAELDMEWVVVTDEYGVDLAVRSRQVEVGAFPHASVVKRIEANQYDFLFGVFYAIKHQIASGDMKPRAAETTH